MTDYVTIRLKVYESENYKIRAGLSYLWIHYVNYFSFLNAFLLCSSSAIYRHDVQIQKILDLVGKSIYSD